MTVREVARHLPPRLKLAQRYTKYVYTREVLGPLLESLDGFAERRIVWAAKCLEGRGPAPTAEELGGHAGLSARQRGTLRPALDRAVAALEARAAGGELPEEWAVRLPFDFEFESGAMVPGVVAEAGGQSS